MQAVVERASRYVKLAKLPRKMAFHMHRLLKDALASLPSQARKSLTYDNGTENAYHLRTHQALETKSYFCAPFHSWEKGIVENSIGLVRRYFQKKTDLAKVSWREFKFIER